MPFPFKVPNDVDSGCTICVLCGYVDGSGARDCPQDHGDSGLSGFGSMVYIIPAIWAGIAVVEKRREEGMA